MILFKTYFRGMASHRDGKATRGPVFGKLSYTGRKKLATQISENYYPDDADGYDKEEYDIAPRKNHFYYKAKLWENASKGPAGLKTMLELFEEMKSIARLEPHFKDYSLLIKSCAKAGYTQRAFELYRELLKYHDRPSLGMVTNLINACAECPFREYGLARLKWFRGKLKEAHGIKLGIIHYNCLIKAYGMLNDARQIEGVIEEMFQNDILPNGDTFNMLLIACASDKQSGTTLALSTFKRMKLYDFKPDAATYRLFLRCIRDCGLGTNELLKKTFAELPAMTTLEERIRFNRSRKRQRSNENGSSDFVWMPRLEELKGSIISGVVTHLSGDFTGTSKAAEETKTFPAAVDNLDENPDETKLLEYEEQLKELENDGKTRNFIMPKALLCDNLTEFGEKHMSNDSSLISPPNLLSDDHLDLFTRIDLIDISKTKTSQQKLLLFGGIHGFLENMVKDGVQPCNRIFGLLLACTKSVNRETIEFYRLSKDYNVVRDVPFYDMLIRHWSHNFNNRDRLQLAMYFMEEMSLDTNLTPNVTTYESLATACDNINEANTLISDLESCGFTISSRLIRQLFDAPLFRREFKYLNQLILLCQERKYKPTKELVHKLIDVKLESYDTICKYENGKLDKTGDRSSWFDESQVPDYDHFTGNLDIWLKHVDLIPDDHPWEQFHVERTSKRQGFVDFVAKFRALKEAKQEALESGSEFGNLVEKAEKILSVKKKQSKLFIPSENRFLSNQSLGEPGESAENSHFQTR